MFIAHKIELRPTEQQEQFLRQTAGARRFVWNQCLAEWNWAYEHGFKPDKDYIVFYFNVLRHRNPWLKDVSMNTIRNTVFDLVDTWNRFFKGIGKRPRFKKRGFKDSFSIRQSEKFCISGRRVGIEKLERKKPVIRMRQKLRFSGEPKQAAFSCRAGKWFVSVLVKLVANPFTNKMPADESQAVGLDLGVKDLAVLSDGTVFPAVRPLKKAMRRLKRLQKQLSRKIKGSNRYKRMKRRIARLHYFISCKRKAILHELTDYLTRNFKVICIEDLNVSGMLKNHRLAGAIADCGFYEFRRQLEYKARFRGCIVSVIDRFAPTSKTCSRCGQIHDMPLSKRVMRCDCGFIICRDKNAAINILKLGLDRIEPDLKRTLESSGCITC